MASYAEAWSRYLAALDECRAMVEADPAAQSDAKLRDAALYLPTQLNAAAFHMHMAPHRDYPLMYLHQIFSLFELSWGLPNADYAYRFGYLDGRRTYRLTAPRRSQAPWFNLVIFNAYFEDGARVLGDYELNDFATPDGGLEAILGPHATGPGQIPLDPSEHHIVFTTREALEDWSWEMTPLRIECLDQDKRPMLFSEAEQAERLGRATRLVLNATRRSLRNYHRLLEAGGAENRFFIDELTPERKANNAHPSQTMVNCIFHVEPGQSLIIETEVPQQARYWGCQLGDPWWRAVDYVWHNAAYNRRNAHFGADGIFRAVVSHEDPGVQNWLDPVDNDRGQILIRLNQASSRPVPATRLVPSSEVRRHLPADVPPFSPGQRRAQLAARKEHMLRRYGF